MAKHAHVILRKDPHYRRDAFEHGLKRLGYSLDSQPKPGPNSVLVLWNRKPGNEENLARLYESHGSKVVIAENGYIGKDANGHQLYAMALNGHNGSGRWFIGDADRWLKLGIEIKPWREPFAEKGYVLICAQRGIGSKTMASPPGWHRRVLEEQRRFPGAGEMRTRMHPGSLPSKTTLEQDWAGARGLLIWSSSSGVKALVAGLPVCYNAPHWVCAGAGTKYASSRALTFYQGPREIALARMAWAQWTLEEIGDGTAFECLLNQGVNS